ncbi:LptF/LptG family permease [Flavobacteriales bacterium]|nr:LptF/LptG family permease [Flavobacteriales bacterium]
MKILDKYILKSYMEKFFSFFVLIMFVFIFQTIWMFIDDLAGKEVDYEIIFKFLLYYTPKLIPLILPLTVLLASIMTFGDLAENYEFAAIKSSGISLIRSMRGLIAFNLILCISVFFVSNNLIPYAEFKSYNLRKNLAKVKPALAITEGVFNNIGIMNIKVDDKYGLDNSNLKGIIIHKSNINNDNNIVIKASSGKLVSNEYSDVLKIELNDGYRYEEIYTKNSNTNEYKPQTKIYFEKHEIYIDLKELNNVDFSDEKYSNTFRMQNINELKISIDSLENKLIDQYQDFSNNFYKRTGIYNFQTNYINNSDIPEINSYNTILENFDKVSKIQIIASMQNNIENQINNLKTQRTNFFIREKLINLHKSNLHGKFAISFAAIILFFVGAPLGAIIRKGGFGYPVVIALLLFLTYHFVGTFARNAAEDGSINPFIGSWVSNLIMIPISIYLLIRASSDKSILNIDNFYTEFLQLLNKIKFFK